MGDEVVTGVGINKDLSALYSDYYTAGGQLEVKRAIAAKDSTGHMRIFFPNGLGRVVDVGAGNGSVMDEIARANLASEISALEISASGIERILDRKLSVLKDVKQFDGYKMPYDNDSFDTAICVHVLEHVEHERLFLRELGRIASDVFIEVPLEGCFRGRINYKHGHINYYSPVTLRALLETSGLEIIAARVVTSSMEYERHCNGYWGGTARTLLRQSLLNVAGNRATDLMTYLMAVHCRKAMH